MFSGVFNGGITVIYILLDGVWVCDVSMCVRVCD